MTLRSKAHVAAAVNNLTVGQVREFKATTDKLIWLEHTLDLPSVCTDLGERLAEFAEELIEKI